MQNHISCFDLSYSLPDGSFLFSSISHTFGSERTALIGPNGIGKTTLLEILSGIKAASGGSLTRSGSAQILRQSEDFQSEDSVADALRISDVLAALERIEAGSGTPTDFECVENRWEIPQRGLAVFAELGISHINFDRPIDSLSGGELMRVRIARLLLATPDFLLFDEPTNHLDLPARAFLYEFIRSWKKGLIVVSHDRRLLAEVDCIAELTSTGLKLYGGNFEFYREQKEMEDAAAQAAFDGAKQRLKRAEAMAADAQDRQRRRQASGRYRKLRTGMPKMMAGNLRRQAELTAAKLSRQHESRVEAALSNVELARKSVPVERHIQVDLSVSGVPPGRRLVELRSANYRYPESRRDLWTRPLDFLLTGPERIWVKGPNGSGKSTLIDIICGTKQPSAGDVVIGAAKVALLDQRVSVLDDTLSLLDNIRRCAPRRSISSIRTLLGRFLFVQDAALKPVSGLSGGERIRAGIACLLAADQAPELLILDEPTNNLDLTTIEGVTSAVSNFGGALVIVSHDLDFLEEVGLDRTLDLGEYSYI